MQWEANMREEFRSTTKKKYSFVEKKELRELCKNVTLSSSPSGSFTLSEYFVTPHN